uniref:Uncharacterized protein n=1 Tax=Panagrolaimus sp. JU765 TaxID=591449 RepID=A0AC34PXV4_9BILA
MFLTTFHPYLHGLLAVYSPMAVSSVITGIIGGFVIFAVLEFPNLGKLTSYQLMKSFGHTMSFNATPDEISAVRTVLQSWLGSDHVFRHPRPQLFTWKCCLFRFLFGPSNVPDHFSPLPSRFISGLLTDGCQFRDNWNNRRICHICRARIPESWKVDVVSADEILWTHDELQCDSR